MEDHDEKRRAATDQFRRLRPRVDVTYAGEAARVLDDTESVPSTRPAVDGWFLHLYKSHFPEVIRLILRFGIPQDDAEDLTQRVFMVAHRRRLEVETFAEPRPWLCGVTIRIVREHYRWRRVRNAARWLLEIAYLTGGEDQLTPERQASADESLERVGLVLAHMSGKLREALVLIELEQLTPREAANLLRIPYNTLRSRHASARQEFKRLWEQQQGTACHG